MWTESRGCSSGCADSKGTTDRLRASGEGVSGDQRRRLDGTNSAASAYTRPSGAAATAT